MHVCIQCNGKGYTVLNNLSVETYLGSNVFTAPTQNKPSTCNYCLGTGIDNGAGS